MTVSSEINKSGPYFCNGVTTVFDYDFRIIDESHVRVINASETGAETVLLLDVHYSVTGVGDPLGGQIVLFAAPPAGETITNLRNIPFVQETDLENQGAYFAETVEAALDLAAMRDQQLSEQIDRAVKIPASADPSALDTLIQDIVRLNESADNIDTVAGVAAQVAAVAEVAASVPVAAGIAGEIAAVAAIGPEVEQVAEVATDIPAVAANAANISTFAKVYQGAKEADPTTRNDGSPLQAGDLYYNPGTSMLRVYAGTGESPWRDAALAIDGLDNLLRKDDNLASLADKPLARTNLGLKSGATKAVMGNGDFRANVPDKILDTGGVWAGAGVVTLTDAATIAADLNTFFNAKVTLGGNRVIDFTNAKVGQTGRIEVFQDGTGSRTLSYTAGQCIFPGGAAPTLTTTAGARDVLYYDVMSDGKVFVSLPKDAK